MVFGKIVAPFIPKLTVDAFKEVMNRKGDDRYADMGTEKEALLDAFFEFELRFQHNEKFKSVLDRACGRLIGNTVLSDGMIDTPSFEGYGLFIDTNQSVIRDSSDTMAFIKVNAKAFNYLNSLAGSDYVQFDLLIRDSRNGSSLKLSDMTDDQLDETQLDSYTVIAFGLKSVDYDTVYPS